MTVFVCLTTLDFWVSNQEPHLGFQSLSHYQDQRNLQWKCRLD